MLRGRLQQAVRVLARHGLAAVLAVRLVPLFPSTPLNHVSGLLGVRGRDHVLGMAIGIVTGVGGPLVLGLLGDAVARGLVGSNRTPDDGAGHPR